MDYRDRSVGVECQSDPEAHWEAPPVVTGWELKNGSVVLYYRCPVCEGNHCAALGPEIRIGGGQLELPSHRRAEGLE